MSGLADGRVSVAVIVRNAVVIDELPQHREVRLEQRERLVEHLQLCTVVTHLNLPGLHHDPHAADRCAVHAAHEQTMCAGHPDRSSKRA